MSSFDKTVKLACKPKAAVPKAKYLDPIVAATWSDDGAVHDVCKALVPRFREPNAVVVFKALIVLHTMMRNGSTDNVLSYLSSSNVLRLRNISSANWEGYAAPQNLQNYALYLESRIVAYKELKHDAIKVQSESNRDMRNSQSVEDGGTITHRGRKDRRPTEISAPTRSKTVMGRKLRSMTVEKGLLRETRVVHRMIDALVECRFYLDDLEDELTITALRMLVKDLLILFQAGNEGVINVLENYFEMSHVDAKEALRLYRRFCTQTENVVEYLGVARKLQNLLNVPIPNLKHAPVSLAGALQGYLDDPNFEQNRKEYRINKGAVEQSTRAKVAKPSSSQSNTDGKSPPTPPKQAARNGGESSTAVASSALDGKKRETLDFFAAIEEEQPTMFNPQTNSPNTSYFQQQASINPFSQMLSAQASAQPQQFVVTAQPTGFLMPQATAVPSQPNPFGNFFTPQVAQPGPFSTFIPQQPTGLLQQTQPMGALQAPQPFLQPQMTGANPFRQSMLIPQTTGMQLFGVANQSPVPVPSLPQSQTMMNLWQTSDGLSSAPASTVPYTAPRPSSPPITHVPARPSSTPLTFSNTTSSTLLPVKTHQTGTKNPFGPISVAPPVPKPPTLFELSAAMNQPQISPQNSQPHQPQPEPPTLKSFDFGNSSLNPGAADISSVASSFAFVNGKPRTTATPPNNDWTKSATSSATGSNSLFSSSLSTQPTGLTSTSAQAAPSTSMLSSTSPVQSRLQGLKPFKPTSSFGTSLFESLPPIAGSGPVTPAVTGLPSTTNAPDHASSSTANALSSSFGHSGFGSASLPQPSSNMSFFSSQPTGATGGFGTSSFGSTLGVGLRPQVTGGGAANPFRASMAGGMPNFGASAAHPVPPLPIGLAGFQNFGSVGGMPMGLGTSQLRSQTQQQANGSLI